MVKKQTNKQTKKRLPMQENLRLNSGSIPESGRSPGGGNGVLLSGKFHRQRRLAGYSPWHCTESDMTKRLSTHTQSMRTASKEQNLYLL